MKKYLALLLLSTCLYGNGNQREITPPFPNRPAQTCEGMSRLYATGDFIYWKARQDETISGIAKIGLSQGDGTFSANFKLKDLNYQFSPGFKLGIGAKPPFDGWDLYLNWTHLHNHSKSTFTSSSHDLVDIEQVGEQELIFVSNKAQNSYRLMFNSLDFTWGRRYFVSETWLVRPSFGVKTAWLHQTIRFDFKNMETFPFPEVESIEAFPEFLESKNTYWGIGPYFSFEGKWMIAYGLGLYGQVSGAIFWGSFDQHAFGETNALEIDNQDLILSLDYIDQRADAHRVRPTFQMFIGLDWERCLISNKLSAQLRAGYETQFFFAQLVNIRDVEESNVSLEGLTLSARLDF